MEAFTSPIRFGTCLAHSTNTCLSFRASSEPLYILLRIKPQCLICGPSGTDLWDYSRVEKPLFRPRKEQSVSEARPNILHSLPNSRTYR